jgi:protein-disulfide isomerase
MDNRQTAFVGLSFLALGLMIGLVFSNGMPVANNVLDSNQDGTIGPEVEFVSVSEDDDAFLGDADAPVVIVEFSDYQCPYCESFALETMPLIKEKYIDTGLVKLVFRDFPIPSHADAATAAIGAECVAEQGGNEGYFAMHDMLFERTSEWSYQDGAENIIIGFASELGFDISACISDPAMLDEVEADYIAARSYGVGGTPTFFINGNKLVGAYPFDVFEQLIDAEL